MSDRPTGTGVRSLLAKFENNISTSPPSRGRSPIGTEGSGNARPLSKVRANFIPVERNGGAGSPLGFLRRADSGDSPVSIRPSFAHEFGGPIEKPTPQSPAESSQKAFLDKPATSTPSVEKQEQSDCMNTTTIDAPEKVISGLGAILKGSPFEDSKPQTASHKNAPPLRKLGSAVPEEPKNIVPETRANLPPKQASVPTKPDAPETKTASSRPSNIMISNNSGAKNTVSRGPKTPSAPRTPKLPQTPETQARQSSVESPATTKGTNKAQPRTNTPRRLGGSTLSPATKPKPPRENASRPGSKHTSPDQKKVRSRSPTRPVRLPSSMTAPTASSAAKTNNNSRPVSRNGTHTTNHTNKSSSARIDRGTTVSKAPALSTSLRKQSSRPSLAPPANLDRPKSRTNNTHTRTPDESFLARMMRPTASSASKVHDKIETKSPPRTSRSAKPAPRAAHKSDSTQHRKSKSPEVHAHEAPASQFETQAPGTSGEPAILEVPEIPEEPKAQVVPVNHAVNPEPEVPHEPELPAVNEDPIEEVDIKEPETVQA